VGYISDDVARILASPIPRRKAFTRLTGVLFGAVLGSFGIGPAYAQSSGCKPACKKSQTCCGTTCINSKTTQCCSNTPCPSNKTCCGTAQAGNTFCLTPPKQCSNTPGQ
jgi:hypothetical protein